LFNLSLSTKEKRNMPSKALEANLATSFVDVTISEKYEVLQEIMQRYHGILQGLNTFLKELGHPYRNWQFIVKEARVYSLDYFHLLISHPQGPAAARLYIDIFLDALDASPEPDLKAEAADNLLIYLQKLVNDSGSELPRFMPVLDDAFNRIKGLNHDLFFFFVKSYYQINRLAENLYSHPVPDINLAPIHALLIRYLEETYAFWLKEKDPYTWLLKELGSPERFDGHLTPALEPVRHEQLRAYQNRLKSLGSLQTGESVGALIKLPAHGQIVDYYRDIPRKLFRIGSNFDHGNYWKLIFLFFIMDSAGLSIIHRETLRDINRTLSWVIGHEETKVALWLIQKTFAILKSSIRKYPGTALHCVLNMGKAVYKTDESELVDAFIDSVVDLGFQAPDVRGFDNEWQVKVNTAHIQNIRTWLELIELNPKWSKKLFSALIIHLSLTGVFIRDTDLFPRDITHFLNSDIGPTYNLAKQLTRLFPAFFNDIGAEGRLRDISTRIDEICLRKDHLVHFLRKQSHVESSNQIVSLIEGVFEFWRTRNKAILEPLVPPNVYQQIENTGPYVDGVHMLITRVFKEKGLKTINGLLSVKEENLQEIFSHVSGINDTDRERMILAVTFYQMLYQKYRLSPMELESHINQLKSLAFPDLNKLEKALASGDRRQKLYRLLSYLEQIKELILSPEQFEIREDIYRKRHIAVDIPSMYGSYHELKFDVLGLTFRIETLVNILFEELVQSINLELITRDTFSQIYDYLWLFNRALRLDGIVSSEIETQLDLLARSFEVRDFSFTQFLDIFRGLSQGVRNIVNDYFSSIHQQNLRKIISQVSPDQLTSKYRPTDPEIDQENMIHIVTEIFIRERIASSLGLQQLDLFLSRIMNTLHQQSDKLPKEQLRLLLNYDPQKVITPIHPVNSGLTDIIYIGNKGFNLVKLNELGIPVPPGFIITTELFRCREIIEHYPPAEKNLKDQITKHIAFLEEATGRGFSNPQNPLLLSIRSGAPISQPGMMDTFLDVGINEEIVQGVIGRTKNEWFAWDCFRRFLQSYGMAFGLGRDDFDDIIGRYKQKLGIPLKRQFSGEQMKKVAMSYKDYILENGIPLEDSPFEQLYLVIQKVFESWNSYKAGTYRNIMGISDDWGTAVTVQTMVFGNLTQQSGAGVLFTHSPRLPGDMIRLWGDFTTGNQGEDVVSGLVKTLPISIKQAKLENRENEVTLESHFPKIYQAIRKVAKSLIYDGEWGPQEMEFTFESPSERDLYFLQTRDMGIREKRKIFSFILKEDSESRLLGHGIGVGGGAVSGRVVFNRSEIRRWREQEPDSPLILVRGDTVPDDIKEIYEADGLLTGRGGSTSHAAIVAYRLGKTGVVGCSSLICLEKESSCSLEQVHLKEGDWISIDGHNGAIYSGKMEVEEITRR
jgi:pyruvate,orthophosphate dikinase